MKYTEKPLEIRELLDSKFTPRILKTLSQIELVENTPTDSVYAYGDNGTGKSTYIAMTLANLCKRPSDVKKCEFCNTTELLLNFRATFKPGAEKTEKELLDYYSKVQYLALDDFGVEKVTDWAYQMLYILINRRYEKMMVTFFTANLDLEELGAKMGDMRIPSRIQEMATIMNFTGKDYRADKKQ